MFTETEKEAIAKFVGQAKTVTPKQRALVCQKLQEQIDNGERVKYGEDFISCGAMRETVRQINLLDQTVEKAQMSDKQYVCGNCGWYGKIEECHVSEKEHLCPSCGKAGYHFSATPRINALFNSFDGAEWISAISVSDACEKCWTELGLTKPDYTQYILPDPWIEDTERSCGDRTHGVAAKLKFDHIPFMASVRSLSMDEVLKKNAWFHVGLTQDGSSWTRRTEHQYVQTWEDALSVAESWLLEQGGTHLTEIETYVSSLKETAKQKGYKAGWVWYQVKDKYGVDIANTVLPKEQLMRYVLKLEAIGDNHIAYRRHMEKAPKLNRFGRSEIDAYKFGNKRRVAWCAEITGVNLDGNLERQFVDGNRDWRDSNSTGSRGIFTYYALRPGLYEINSPESWSRVRRYFIKVIDDVTAVEISKEELLQCLQNDTQAST